MGNVGLRLSRPPPLRKVFLARSTSTAASVGSGETDSAPASMRPPTPESPKRDGGGQDNEAHRRP